MKSGLALVCMSIFCLFFQACGYSGGPGYGGTLNCVNFCNKAAECCEAYPDCGPWDDDHNESCMYGCDEANKTMTTEALLALQECADLPCLPREDRVVCGDEVLACCTGKDSPQLTRLCNRIVECFPDMAFEECTDHYDQIVACYTQKALDAMASCAENASCDTYNDDFSGCLQKELGLYPHP